MAFDKEKMHNRFSIMQIHAQNMHFVLEKSGYAKLSTEVHARSGLEQPRQALGRDSIDIKKLWNNFLRGIFLAVLKLFQSGNIIPHPSTNDGISIFQLFQAASTRLEYYSKVIPGNKNNSNLFRKGAEDYS
jgi:hypothetical protein